jgi:hypothetical protein
MIRYCISGRFWRPPQESSLCCGRHRRPGASIRWKCSSTSQPDQVIVCSAHFYMYTDKNKIKFSLYIRKFGEIGWKVIYDYRPPHIYGENICAFSHILGIPSSYTTLHPIPFLIYEEIFFYQCTKVPVFNVQILVLLFMCKITRNPSQRTVEYFDAFDETAPLINSPLQLTQAGCYLRQKSINYKD